MRGDERERGWVWCGAAGGLAAALLVGAGGLPAAAKDIKVCLIAGKTGALEAYAKQTENGFMLGLEYSGGELIRNLRTGLPAGLADLLLNFTPGFLAGLLLKWNPLAAILLGGVTYISSSGVIAKVLGELNRMNHPETPTILSVLVLEDLAMALYLPVV